MFTIRSTKVFGLELFLIEKDGKEEARALSYALAVTILKKKVGV